MTNDEGWTALHYSARIGNYEFIKFFADAGTDINLKTNNGMNCFHIAADFAHLNLCKTLIDKHNFHSQVESHDGWTALHYSARNGSYELVNFFANMGNDINLKNNLGWNCLHIAALYGHLTLCKTLINKHNFDVEIASNDGWTALHYSAKNGSYDLVNFFSQVGIDINCRTYDGRNCLHIAADCGHLTLCKTFINKYNFDVQIADNAGWTALHYSARFGNYSLVNFFARMGNYINLKSNRGWNCLHIAALYGHLPLCKTLINKHNFDVQIADNDGWTALHSAAKSGSYELVNFFSHMGTDISIKTYDGRNCLHIAADYGHLTLCETLINKHNFDVQIADNAGWTALHYSARNGSCKLVKFFANMGNDINLKSTLGWNCLHVAALYGHLSLCRTLIDRHNFDVQIASNDGWVALHYSARNGSYELVKFFADMGNDINLKTNLGWSCLHIAALHGRLSLCKTLINKHNFDVQIATNDGWTALHYSARNGNYELVKLFANLGNDINLKSNQGWNCLHIAALHGHLSLCRTLIERHNFDVQIASEDGWVALHYSARNGSYEIVNFFAAMGTDIKLQTNLGWNCLHIAALHGHLTLCKILTNKHNFDVQIADNAGWTALHYSARNGSYELVNFFAAMGTDINLKTNLGWNCLHIAALFGHLTLCKTLVNKHKFNVHIMDNDGWTALHYSARNGSYELVNFFCGAETDINLKTNDERNIFHIAADYGHLGLGKTLINKHNFDVQISDKYGWTALHFAVRNDSYELVKFFVDIGADVNLKTNLGWNCLHIAALYGYSTLCKTLVNRHNFDVKTEDSDGWTALHYSARNGSYELVKFFAVMGTNINLKTNLGLNCLHITALYGHLPLCKTLINKHNFDAQIADNDGCTAFHYSARNGSYELVKFFIDMGTDINIITNDGKNCFHIAALYGHLNLCKVFIEKHNFDVRKETNYGWTALHFSARNGSFDLFSYILDKGSEIFCKTKKMENVLHLSSLYGHFDICEFVLKYFIKDYEDNNMKKQYALNGKSYSSQVFYKYKIIFLHAMDVDGNTYLHLAARGNEAKVCKLLLRYDTQIITLLNKEDKTAKEIAKDNGHKDVLNALKVEYERAGIFF